MADKIVLITGDAGESFEVLYAKQRLLEAGYQVVIAAPSVKALHLVIHDFEPGWDTYVERPGYYVESDASFEEINPEEFKAVLCIGGRAPEYLRHQARVLDLVRQFDRLGKHIFSICHGIQILIAAGLVANRTVTCYEHIRFEVEACGGTFIQHQEAVQDGRLITGQTWQSHPQFYQLVLAALAQP